MSGKFVGLIFLSLTFYLIGRPHGGIGGISLFFGGWFVLLYFGRGGLGTFFHNLKSRIFFGRFRSYFYLFGLARLFHSLFFFAFDVFSFVSFGFFYFG